MTVDELKALHKRIEGESAAIINCIEVFMETLKEATDETEIIGFCGSAIRQIYAAKSRAARQVMFKIGEVTVGEE